MSQTKVPYVINLFGSAIQLWELCPSPTLQLEMLQFKDSTALDWHELLFDLELIRKFKVKHWTEIAKKIGGSELILNSEARIELRKNGRIAERIQVAELVETTQLFAQYTVRVAPDHSTKQDSLLIIEELKGQVGKFTFEATSFQMEQLSFYLRQDFITAATRLSSIALNDQSLRSIKEDLLLVTQRVVLL